MALIFHLFRAILGTLVVGWLNSAVAVLIRSEAYETRNLAMRTTSFVPSGTLPTGDTYLVSDRDLIYLANVTVSGEVFLVALDTGSSDLVIVGTLPNVQTTNIVVNDSYISDDELGHIAYATVEFAGYTVENQVFNLVPANQSTFQSMDGLLGLGPPSDSKVKKTAKAENASSSFVPDGFDPFLDRLFQQDSSVPNFMTFNLQRSFDNSTAVGMFTVGEVLSGFEGITSMPQLNVSDQSEHWDVLLDGITGNNGAFIPLQPSVDIGAPLGKLVATLDSGTSLAYVPSYIATALYSNIPHASLVDVSGEDVWILPCDQEVHSTFVFGGHDYPIDPLDLAGDPSYYDFTAIPSGFCVGLYRPMTEDVQCALNGTSDMLLGLVFLRNVYMLMNWGALVDSDADASLQAYVQLLSTTNGTEASEVYDQLYTASGTWPSPSPYQSSFASLVPSLGSSSGAHMKGNVSVSLLSGLLLLVFVLVNSL